jgi:hypothetical protein
VVFGFGDYTRFRNIAISEPGIMNEREYDLLTAAPSPIPAESGERKGSAPGADPFGVRKVTQLRAINRGP